MANEAKKFEAEDVGSIKLRDSASLRVRIINNEDLDIRVWIEGDKYTGWSRSGWRFSLSDDTWIQFKALMEKVDKKHKELVA